ncbi:hypothetical protein P280DRAFT_474057 [Massarina eburnea CBS 473.64]|uniref:Only prolin and serin are matching in the corresponding protein n=1 Tax=Massarina eburnea CBS 473.64 TaxID=1395130 RepID=A0A6A6RIJ7_9PLEO|nr:hypothetical protein P280DRAFT_474057 [Massarina eburnea CBS 473.64]
MREMKPLMLPKLVAQRKSSKSSLDMATDPASSICSNTDSGFYSASECSTPPTPSFHRGHLRFPSSTSSLSSSPPTYDPIEPSNSSCKLPKLTEDVEREDDYGEDDYVTVSLYRCSADIDEPEDPNLAQAYDFDHYGIVSKRRRSIEQGVAHRLERSFPSLSRSLSRKVRSDRKRASSRSTTPPRQPSTRSSSMTSSIHNPLPITARSSKERLNDSIISLPIDIAKANAHAHEIDVEEIESERFATTPLLPPMLATARHGDMPTQSPLQSPTVAIADPMQSLATTPVDSPAYPTPPLSTKASITSFKRTSPLVPSNDIPPIMLTDPTDKWAVRLGHDNFTILPEPYSPQVCDAASRDELFADWQQARGNFTKHQVRIAEHYGPTSKIYLLCEQKWAEIDAVWKKNHELVKFLVPTEPSEPSSPVEPVPVSTIWPTLNDPNSEGKFPQLGDEDIVGPMVQAAPKVIHPITPRKRAFFKFLADLKFPGSFLGRSSSTGMRGH